MQCNSVKMRFSRQLKHEEQILLIAHFKGFVETAKKELTRRRRGLDLAGSIGARLGHSEIQMVQQRISALLSPMVIDGVETSMFEQYFSLDYDETNPEEYRFVYPSPSAIFGLAGVANLVKGRINTDFKDKLVFKDIVNEAGLVPLLLDLTVESVERDLK